MSWETTLSQIMAGDEVFGSDGDKVGSVAEVQQQYIVVEKGWFFPTDYYIPMSAISSVANGQVHLTVSKDAALHSGWDTVPEAVPMAAAEGTAIADADVLVDDREFVDDRVMAATHMADQDEIHIPVMEEELTATVRAQEAGAVRIEKHVVAEERVLDVPITEERVRVERRVVDRPVAATDVDAFEETVIDVPVMTEKVDIQKRARVAEEVIVSKDAVQRTEQVRGTVRREQVTVDEDAVIDAPLVDDGEDGALLRP